MSPTQCYPQKIVMSPTAVLNLHIKSYSPYFNSILYMENMEER
jgi:hypothetical protein